MSVGVYSFGNSMFSNFLSVYVVSLSILIFFWVLISVFLNIFLGETNTINGFFASQIWNFSVCLIISF